MSNMKFISLLIFILSACGGENGSNENSLPEVSNNSLLGAWAYTHPATQCVETYHFTEPDYVTISSLDEVTNGVYSVDEEDYDTNRHQVRIQIYEDNQMMDCHGNSDDDVAGVIEIYAEFISPAEITIYSDRYAESSNGEWVLTEN